MENSGSKTEDRQECHMTLVNISRLSVFYHSAFTAFTAFHTKRCSFFFPVQFHYSRKDVSAFQLSFLKQAFVKGSTLYKNTCSVIIPYIQTKKKKNSVHILSKNIMTNLFILYVGFFYFFSSSQIRKNAPSSLSTAQIISVR